MEFKNTEVYGFEAALRGMRNPMNSHNKADSCYSDENEFIIGPNDMKLALNLIASGNEHSKFLRFVHVAVDVDMPRYWWSEADTYRFGNKNSQSTMHKLLNNNNPITKDLFVTCEEDADVLDIIVGRLESLRIAYKDIQRNSMDDNKADKLNYLLLRAKRLLPEGFLQMRTWDTNYAELRSIYHQRKDHRLKEEWQDVFCNWVRTLPYAEEFLIN